MFTGAINTVNRSVVSEIVRAWEKIPVYVGCSGNFTVERILWKEGFRELHSNDVALYSCVVGAHLAGRPMDVRIESEAYAWLSEYMDGGGCGTIAVLLICSEFLQYEHRDEPYHRRMREAYRSQFRTIHERTVERVEVALQGMRVSSFDKGDVVEFLDRVPDECALISYPPTYRGGYERLYRAMDEVFEWNEPEYELFDEERFKMMLEAVVGKNHWILARDHEVPELADSLRGIVQTGMRSKPFFVYTDQARAKVVAPHQHTQALAVPRLRGELQGDLRVVKITQRQMNLLRSEYLSPGIVPAQSDINLAVLCGDELVGALGFRKGEFMSDVYMMTDFAVRPTVYGRLAKLVLAAALSRETRIILEQLYNRKVKTVATTAFSDNAVSMKYRGLFDLYSRKKGKLTYVADLGRCSLKEGMQWWMKNHALLLSA